MEIWNEINDTLSILLWPAVVAIGMYIFRHQLRDLGNRIVKGKVGGFELELERAATAEANKEFRAVTRTVSDELGVSDEVAVEGSFRSTAGADADADDKGEAPTSEPGFTRKQVEGFIRAAAMAGYDIGEIRMFQSQPEPVIRWTDENVPEIQHWQSIPADPREQAQRLEQEIKTLTLEENAPISRGEPSILSGRKTTIEELKQRLRDLDPNSPWAI